MNTRRFLLPAKDSWVRNVQRGIPADRQQHRSRVRVAALAQLTPLQQEAIHLTYYLGCTSTEAGKFLGIPKPTFKARLHSGLVNLRRITQPTDIADR